MNEPLQTQCPHCGCKYEIEPDQLGQHLKCGQCGGAFTAKVYREESGAAPAGAPQTLNVRLVGDHADEIRQVEIVNINLTIERMIALTFKWMIALILVNLILALPIILIMLLLGLQIFGR